MTLAAIIAKHQKAGTPHVLGTWEERGNVEAVAAQRVPGAPTVPGEKGKVETNNAERRTAAKVLAHLLVLAERRGMDPAHVGRLPPADLLACEGWSDAHLVTYLELLADTATRWAGKAPQGHTAAIHCHHCGPVWVTPSMAACLPVVDGWPRALGCPWCAIRKVGAYIPRPATQCVSRGGA